jgi:uncharacterized protein YjbJ (UPF0337 family)
MAIKCHERAKRALRNHLNESHMQRCWFGKLVSAAPPQEKSKFPNPTRRDIMNWDQIEGKWKQMKGSVKQKWGRLTDDDLDVVAGKQEQLAGKIQERYGITKEEAAKQVREWSSTVHDVDTTTPQRRAS